MVDAMRAMLDELMGKERNVPLDKRSNKRIRFDDPTVCKFALAGLCPYGLFKNTRSDLGPCGYEIHEDHIEWETLQGEYNKQDPREHERYERRLMKVMEDLIREMDRKIAKAKDRAEAESSARPLKPEDAARLADMQAKAKEMLQKSQEAGEAGEVDVSMALAQQATEMQAQHDRLHKSLTAPERTMSVCDICGVFINSTDNDQRRQEHLTGKQYLGWKAIREKYAELTSRWEARARSREPELLPPPPAAPSSVRERSGPPPEERERSRDRERERERSPRREDRDRGYERGRSGGSGYDDRDRGYDRDRGHDRDRGYDRGYDRRDDRGYDRGYERGRGGYDDRRDRGGYEDRGRGGGGYDDGYRSGSGRRSDYEDRRRY
ncbi:hypothetical protein CHLRE_14g621300v5 [Chlamydomonas reinhardtii]|uniref:Luc7-like protein n=1 Tax=Chlamydomonas reinhardtii TaxID=3055 RepID=A8HP50_CHLRE|nr:uncharacterized protein CHLRE_14g621300v5 [Chlamydomonas reinhardtii]PNW73163.1 hypothetical protein CHLRE_14g621300v5 [Chlamydomonas reinhardtii]|eukprot:XP_001689857.1 predicted protein [Chlamydomonas reinhardtii]